MFMFSEHGGLNIPDIMIQTNALQANRLNEIKQGQTWVQVAAPSPKRTIKKVINNVDIGTLTNTVDADLPEPYKKIRHTVTLTRNDIDWGNTYVKTNHKTLYKIWKGKQINRQKRRNEMGMNQMKKAWENLTGTSGCIRDHHTQTFRSDNRTSKDEERKERSGRINGHCNLGWG